MVRGDNVCSANILHCLQGCRPLTRPRHNLSQHMMEPSNDTETIAMREFGEAAQPPNSNDPAAEPLMSVSDNPGGNPGDAGFENVPLDD